MRSKQIENNIENLNRAVAELYVSIKEVKNQENELLDMYLELNRLKHRVKELEDDGK